MARPPGLRDFNGVVPLQSIHRSMVDFKNGDKERNPGGADAP